MVVPLFALLLLSSECILITSIMSEKCWNNQNQKFLGFERVTS